jgi:hypothetical protein
LSSGRQIIFEESKQSLENKIYLFTINKQFCVSNQIKRHIGERESDEIKKIRKEKH